MQYRTVKNRTRRYRSYHGYRGCRSSFTSFLARAFTLRMQGVVRFFANPAVNRKIGRLVVCCVPAVIVCNLVCFLMIHSADNRMQDLLAKQTELESVNIHLLAQRAVAWGPANMEKLAKDKLGLYPDGKNPDKDLDRQYAVTP